MEQTVLKNVSKSPVAVSYEGIPYEIAPGETLEVSELVKKHFMRKRPGLVEVVAASSEPATDPVLDQIERVVKHPNMKAENRIKKIDGILEQALESEASEETKSFWAKAAEEAKALFAVEE